MSETKKRVSVANDFCVTVWDDAGRLCVSLRFKTPAERDEAIILLGDVVDAAQAVTAPDYSASGSQRTQSWAFWPLQSAVAFAHAPSAGNLSEPRSDLEIATDFVRRWKALANQRRGRLGKQIPTTAIQVAALNHPDFRDKAIVPIPPGSRHSRRGL